MQTKNMISIIRYCHINVFFTFCEKLNVSQKVFQPIVHEYYYGCMYHSIVLKLAHLLARAGLL